MHYDLTRLEELYQQWTDIFPNIKPYFAVKCNPDVRVIETLARLGAGFDCASGKELMMANSICGTRPDDSIIFANTIKLPADLEYAAAIGVRLVTADCVEEVEKIARHHPSAEIVIRVACNGDPNALIPFRSKFGAREDEWTAIMDAAAKAGIRVRGASFHVGSGCVSGDAYVDAIQIASRCLDAIRKRGWVADILDIGGGFSAPISEGVSGAILGAISENIKEAVKVIAEPGRYFVESICRLRVPIIGKRVRPDETAYWIRESIYGCFADVAHGYLRPQISRPSEWSGKKDVGAVIYGCTCDGTDIILEGVRLPADLAVGDFLEFANMGAYTVVLATDFNGMGLCDVERVYGYLS